MQVNRLAGAFIPPFFIQAKPSLKNGRRLVNVWIVAEKFPPIVRRKA